MQVEEVEKEVIELRRRLHESQVSYEDELKSPRAEHDCSCEINSEFEKEVERLNDELVRMCKF